ncbi:MAG: ribonuclease J [Candidatus Peribacteria bacterium]|nr:MAG: ribonuclease J [Candidatus Peribacteria bacterium]
MAHSEPIGQIKKGEKPLRMASLMGLTQVGQCLFLEYGDDLILIDAGMEFAATETLGADYIIPDVSYIKKNIKKLRGIIVTHGHLDHVGALRDILPDLGFPMIYTTPLALGIIKKTFDDQKEAAKIKYTIVNPDTDIVKLGCFTIEFANVNHNIPETMAMAIHTPKGMIVNIPDFKIDHTPAIDKPADLAKFARFGAEGCKLLIADSLGCTTPGWSKSEAAIGDTIDSTVKHTDGRLFVATFASNVGRVIQLIQSAVRHDRIVFVAGRSMINNIEICQQLGYINAPKGLIRNLKTDDINSVPDKRVLVLSTGAQGEEFAALTRISRDDFNGVRIAKGDTVLLSASVIPGNESQMQDMLNNFAEREINVITNKDMDIHASGHGGEEEHKFVLAMTRPEFFMPYYIDAAPRFAYKKLAMKMGMEEERILMPHHNGAIIEVYDDVIQVSDEALKLHTVMIDGKGKGHLSGEYVIKARQIMAEHGVINLIFKVDTTTKELVGNIQIESRGFVYSSEVQKVHTAIVQFARKKYTDNMRKSRSVKDNLKAIKDEL